MDIHFLLFDDFETLDAFGPVEILGRIPDANLHYVSMSGGVIRSRQGTEIITRPVDDMVAGSVLLVPGGQGTRTLVNDETFIAKLKQIVEAAEYCLAVCTGSALVAKTGLLDGRQATSNKRAFEWVCSINANVQWIRQSRWVVDSKYYTSSGVSAGMDMSLGFISDKLGMKVAEDIADAIEYIWDKDKDHDLFCIAD